MDLCLLVAAAEAGAGDRNPANGHNQYAADKARKKGPFDKTHCPNCDGITHKRLLKS